jgi:membrane glycosyltransferase
MTGVGVTLYLVLALHNYVLAALAAGLFAPLIGFHFVITLISRRDNNSLISIKGIRRTNENHKSKIVMK